MLYLYFLAKTCYSCNKKAVKECLKGTFLFYNNLMKYLFIDFEFSNSYMNEPKICEFGCVLCDEQFKILDDKDILINPGKGGAFQPTHRGVFSYYHPMNKYYKSREYPKYYEEIKNLLTDKDTIVFGFAVDGDINSILVANRRYRLDQYEIVAYDVQRLLDEYIESNQKLSLEGVFKEKYGDRDEYYDVVPHKPDDDAYTPFPDPCHQASDLL